MRPEWGEVGAKSGAEVSNLINESAAQQDWFDRLRFAPTGARETSWEYIARPSMRLCG